MSDLDRGAAARVDQSNYWLAIAAAFVFFVGLHAYQTMSLIVLHVGTGANAC